MCGIAGIYNFNGEPIDKHSLRRMTTILCHRGPDHEGFYVKGNIGLGYRRLSIIDLTDLGNQPISNEDGSVWMVANSEVYNYQELAQQLKAKGHSFKSKTDAEVIIHAYEEYGPEAVNYFNGMFIFAIWDNRKRSLFIARDRLGIKPLYYLIYKDLFLFASEIKAILQYEGIRREPNPRAIYDYLSFEYVLGDDTFFKQIKKLLPGHYLVVSPEGIRLKEYWDLEFSYKQESESFYMERLKHLLYDSVTLRLRSDVPVGVALSGGIDSSIIASVAGLVSPVKIPTFTGRFTEAEEYDESRYAKIVTDRSKMRYNEVIPKAEDFSTIFPKLIWHLDEPVAGPGVYPQYFVAKKASAKVRVLLGGQGGDELFIGYHRYIRTFLEYSFQKSLFEHKGLLGAGKNLFKRLSKKELAIFFLSRFSKNLEERYFLLINMMNGQSQFLSRNFLNSHEAGEQFGRFCQVFDSKPGANALDKMMYFDIKVYLPTLLHIEDRISMALSIESRLPFLDHRIVELVSCIPLQIKINGFVQKYILKKTAAGIVPAEILARTDKIGFNTPFKLWMKESLRKFILERLTCSSFLTLGVIEKKGIAKLIKNMDSQSNLVWKLLNLSIWHEQFIKS